MAIFGFFGSGFLNKPFNIVFFGEKREKHEKFDIGFEFGFAVDNTSACNLKPHR